MIDDLLDVDGKADSTAFLYLLVGTSSAFHERHVLLRLHDGTVVPNPDSAEFYSPEFQQLSLTTQWLGRRQEQSNLLMKHN